MAQKNTKIAGWLKVNLEDIKTWDWQALILSLVVSCVFWFLHSLSDQHTANVKVPIRMYFEEQGIVALNPPPEFILVNVTGDGWNLLSKTWQLSNEPIEYQIDDPVYAKFVSTRSLLPSINDRFKEVKINYLLEDTVFFNYDTIIQKSFKIAVDTNSIALSAGFKRTSDYLVEPNEVVLNGPKTLLDKLKDTIAVSVGVEKLEKTFNERVKVRYPKNGFITSSHESVNISFEVEQFHNRREKAYIRPQNFPENSTQSYIVIPQEAFVRYAVRESHIDSLQDSIWVTLDFQDINMEDSTICPTFNLDEIYINPEVESSHFRILIE